MAQLIKIHWHLNKETRPPRGDAALVSPHSDFLEPIGFPPPWTDRPWIYGVMVASANGVVAWKRKGGADDPVWAILGKDPARPERLADKLQVLYLYTFGDAGAGAQTVREQDELVLAIGEPGKEETALAGIYEKLYALRQGRGLTREPRNIIYSPSGNLTDPNTKQNLLETHPLFNTAEIQTFMITTESGRRLLEAAGALEKRVTIIAEGEGEVTPAELISAHRRLFSGYRVRYLDCMGGETVLRALRQAGILDEVFVTVTDVLINPAEHEGVKFIMDFEKEGAELIAEGNIRPGSDWAFRRWRFNRR